ncbi:MAG: type II toxin-antitoxin system RelE family toxin [Thermoplasmatota archaeon]
MSNGRRVKLSSRAQRDFKRLGDEMKTRIRSSLKDLASDSGDLDIKKLKGIQGREDLYRLRVGDYGIIYFPSDDDIMVIRIDKRNKVYKFLD